MNLAVPQGYLEGMRRLVLGVTPMDALGGRLPVVPLRIEVETGLPHRALPPRSPYCVPQQDGRPPRALCRHHSGRFALVFQPGLGEHIDLRLWERNRVYLPRRLRVPLLTLAQIEARESAGTGADLNRRARQPVLFPDAAYPLVSGATGLRGRVMRGDSPMRWVLVEAIVPGSAPEVVVARTRGNDRGEFLLVLPSQAVPGAELPAQVTLRVAVSGPASVPVPANDELPGLDPLWDLPQEPLAADSSPDPVADGSQPPTDYQRSASAAREIDFQLGRILTGADEADFEFTPA